MKRRDILKLAPAALVAGAAPAAALCVVDPAETMVMQMFREWLPLWKRSEKLFEADDWDETQAEFTAVYDRMIELENAMMAAPKASITDMAIAIAAATNFGVVSYEDSYFRTLQVEARALAGGAA